MFGKFKFIDVLKLRSYEYFKIFFGLKLVRRI